MNGARSVRARLLNISKAGKISFQMIVTRYLHERFLYRLSLSGYKNNLYLKGGSLVYVLHGITCRPTKDIDLLGKDISNDLESIKNVILNIIATEAGDDQVWFDKDSVKLELITKHKGYTGVRVSVEGGFDTIKQRIQVDIGFGDVVSMKAEEIKYPVLLKDMHIPVIKAYSAEDVFAEKLQTVIELGAFNSRMKDFYDLYMLIVEDKVNDTDLKKSIENTFKNRKTPLSLDGTLINGDLKQNKSFEKHWKTFLKRINSLKDISFETVLDVIIQKVTTLLK